MIVIFIETIYQYNIIFDADNIMVDQIFELFWANFKVFDEEKCVDFLKYKSNIRFLSEFMMFTLKTITHWIHVFLNYGFVLI